MAETSVRPAVAVVTGLDEYQIRLMRGMYPVFAARGIPLVVHANDPFAPGAASPLLTDLVRHGSPFGMITSAADAENEEEGLLALLASLDIPAVHIGVPGQTWVHGDNVTGMRALMTHLLEDRRAERLVLVRGIVHQADSVAREGVFREELQRHGIEVDEDLVINGGFTHDQAYREMRELLGRRRDFDAVVALNDLSALGALGAITDEGLRVPEDVAVTGFDNEQIATHWPGLTTVDQDLEGQGAKAAELLIALHDGVPPQGDVVVPSRLIVRGSTAPRGQAATRELQTAVGMAQVAQAQLAAQDAVLGMNRAMIRCRTLDQVVEALAAHLDRLSIGRCFLATFEHHAEDVDPERHHSGKLARLILDYRDGRTERPPGEAFPTYRLLPPQLRDELDRGVHILQPLSMLDRDLGYVLFEPMKGPVTVTEVLRMDLSRTLDAVANTQELEDHAATLERLVARRTRELENEVLIRRRAERELQRANSELQRSLMLDGLTRIANRAAFARHLEQHWEALAREGGELALLMVDVDLFKAYNDRYGHVLGDEALRIVASCLDQSVRDPQDLACRYGGEEFAVVLPHSGIQGAVAVAVRFRELLADAAIPHAASTVAPVVTASIGIAVVQAGQDCEPGAVVEAADQALYRAKALGRDRVAVAGRGDLPEHRLSAGGGVGLRTGEVVPPPRTPPGTGH